MNPIYESRILAAATKIVMRETGLTVAQIAEKLEVSRKTVYGYLSGERPLRENQRQNLFYRLAEIRQS